jgi:hypothetical protein
MATDLLVEEFRIRCRELHKEDQPLWQLGMQWAKNLQSEILVETSERDLPIPVPTPKELIRYPTLEIRGCPHNRLRGVAGGVTQAEQGPGQR